MITYFQALLLGLLQGLTELFPISSLGHSIVIPWVFNWNNILNSERSGESFFLPMLVAMHVATAAALLIFYRSTWIRIIKGFFSSVGKRRIDSPDARLAWLLLAATIPAGVVGTLFEHTLRTQFAKPLSAMIFLFVNGCVLLLGDSYLKRKEGGNYSLESTARNVSSKLTFTRAGIIGVAQVGALFAGISRSGITMVSGLYSGLNHEDAARFSFLLATPIILGAGIYKSPELLTYVHQGIGGQILVGGLTAGVAAYFTVRYLDRYFRDKTLRPFALYCFGISLALLALGLVRGHF